MIYFWLCFGLVLIVAEAILPGLVSVFVGLGAMTVAGLLHLKVIDNIATQLIVWFISSIIYIFSLRLMIMRFYPSDREKQNIDEDESMIGQIMEVLEPITNKTGGRVRYGESTWSAISEGEQKFAVGDKVEIVGRNNITWLVKEVQYEES